MKALVLLSFFIFSSSAFAVCKVDTNSFYLVSKEGLRDYSPKEKKIVVTYPKIKQITSPYDESYDLYVKAKDGCEMLGDSEIQRKKKILMCFDL